jgi:hypothetical protein
MLRPGTASQNQHKQLVLNDTKVKECLLQGLTKTERMFTIDCHLQYHV